MTKAKEAIKKLFGLNSRGHEVLDTTPVSIDTGLLRPLTLEERVRQAVRTQEWVRFQELNGNAVESFEDADDFDMPDVEDFTSPYEENFDHDTNIQQLNAEIKERRRKKAAKPDPEREDGEPRKKDSVTQKPKAEAEAEA